MWYVKHPFDCIVVGGLCCQRWRGPLSSGSTSQTAGSGGPLPAHSRLAIEAASFLQPGWCQGWGMWKTEHTGGPCSPTLNSPWAGIQTTCHTHSLGRSEGAGRQDGLRKRTLYQLSLIETWVNSWFEMIRVRNMQVMETESFGIQKAAHVKSFSVKGISDFSSLTSGRKLGCNALS